jgi:hypothetical protein
MSAGRPARSIRGAHGPASEIGTFAPVGGLTRGGKRIDDAAEVVLHSGPFVTQAGPRACATLLRVDHTLVSVCGEGRRSALRENNGALDDVLAFPDVARQVVLLKSILVVVGHTCLSTSFSKNRVARGDAHAVRGVDGKGSVNAARHADQS